jgi:type 1 glutamine amidotransferase
VKRFLVVCFLVIFATALQPAFAQTPAPNQTPVKKIRVLILTGNSDWSHPWQGTAPFLQGVLNNTRRFDAKLEEEVNGITSATLANYDVLVDAYYGPRWSPVTEHAIEDFLRSGKGMIGVHGVTYGPFFGQAGGSAKEPRRHEGKAWKEYEKMVGMTWPIKDIGEAKRHVFTVQWVDTDHPISRGLPPTFEANDELYHRIKLKPNAHLLASAMDVPVDQGGTGKVEPMIWTVPYGQGRVVMMVLGHDLLAMSQPGFMDAFARGTEWAATGNVAPPRPRRPRP